jgi:signal transduction histidine kinase
MLTRGMAGPITQQQAALLEVIVRNVRRMEALVSDLTDVSRIQTGRISINLTDVSIPDIIEQTREATIRQIEERRHSLVIDAPPDLPPVKADPKRLLQVMVNLVSNAYKYTPPGGVITITCQARGDQAAISVRDTGVGMTKEELANLGRKFWRAENPLISSEKGTGLGFAITKSLIELMNGELTVSSAPGKGSTFMFTLPVAS